MIFFLSCFLIVFGHISLDFVCNCSTLRRPRFKRFSAPHCKHCHIAQVRARLLRSANPFIDAKTGTAIQFSDDVK